MKEKEIVAPSRLMKDVVASAERAGRSDQTVLLLGESGTGKELLANRIHAASRRAKGPFVSVNCATLPETMAESLLFGHARGAFTNAYLPQVGKFGAANHGTLFLDEIGETSLAVQVKLLRALQEQVIEPLGGPPTKVDVRVVAATNRDLVAMIEAGQFREDLYFRLEVLSIRVPPLRERREDIPALVGKFLADLQGPSGKVTIGDEALACLGEYPWPGNVRELQNFVTKVVVASEAGPVTAADMTRMLGEAGRLARRHQTPPSLGASGGRTKPAASTMNSVAGQNSLAMAWWRFQLVQGTAGQPYACDVEGLERAARIESVAFSGKRARIGREPASVEVALETSEVSRVHATITADDAGFTIADADSRNGTFVDGRLLRRGESAPLLGGTVVRIGKEWLGIAIEIGPTGALEAALGPIRLARLLARAGKTGRTRIEIRALEAICAGRGSTGDEKGDQDDDGLAEMARGLAGQQGLIVEEQVRALLPARPRRSSGLSMTPQQLQAVVDSFGGNKRRAARELGISPTTLHERLQRLR